MKHCSVCVLPTRRVETAVVTAGDKHCEQTKFKPNYVICLSDQRHIWFCEGVSGQNRRHSPQEMESDLFRDLNQIKYSHRIPNNHL